MQKHYEADYNKHVQKNLSTTDRHNAMAQSVGGSFNLFGVFQRELLLQHGLKADDVILDVGCGSGRLANALKDMPHLKFIGIDVVQDLLDYAQEISDRSDWQFIKTNDFKLPLADNSMDMVTAFSLFTHLLHEETYAYLAEMRRVLKPGGKIIFSFLNFTTPDHWTVFVWNLLAIRDREKLHLNQFMEAKDIEIWCQHLQLNIEGIFPGDQPHIQLSETVADDDGVFYRGKVAFGQSIGVLQKPITAQNIIYATLPEGFDEQQYLALNPDVAEAKADPAVHFLIYGQFENRSYK
jgi:ubiquinone/menaquinone biosynthesis C-methylase UbiE